MKILIVDDHPLIRTGLGQILLQVEAEVEVFEAQDATEGFALADRHPELDLVLLDLGLPDLDGQETLAEFRRRYSDLPIVILSGSTDPSEVMRCLRAGAAGFIPKTCSPGVMLGAVRLVMSGGIYLPSDLLLAQDLAQDMVAGGTPMPARQAGRSVRMQAAELGLSNRQAQVLALLVRGQSNKAIARSLDLAEQTVKAHVSAIFRALNVTGRTQALLAIAQLGLDLRSPTEPDMAFAKQPAITPGNR